MTAVVVIILTILASVSTSPPPSCSPDGILLPTALPQDPSLWSPAANLNITIKGLDHEGEAALRLAFDQALILAAAFNHDLGYKTLHKIYISSSSSSNFQCCMCLWVLAYLSSPNINRGCVSSRLAAAKDAARQASLSCMDMGSLLEQELVSSMVARFPANRTAYNSAGLDKSFASWMGEIAATTTEDTSVTADIHAFFAEAVMNTIAWNYYTSKGSILRDEAKPAKISLDFALSVAPDHLLALHLTIHLMEPSSDSAFIETAVAAGDTLTRVIPQDLAAGIAHLIHMPGHAFNRAADGRYHDAVLVNMAGREDDANYVAGCSISPDDFYRQLYYTHKNAFLIGSAMISGESKAALDGVERLFTDCNIVKVAGDMGGVFFSYPPWKLQILLKFGQFAELVETPRPEPTGHELLDSYIGAMFFFTRSFAQASLGNCIESFKDRELFINLARNETLKHVRIYMIHTSDLLDLSENILNGRLCTFCGKDESKCSESEHLALAVEIQDTFPYMEPRYWPDNVRSCLGAALLHENKADEALAVFEKDLSFPEYPGNGWSLKGKELALRALGRDGEAEEVAMRFFEAWKFADVDLYDSCF